MKYALNGAKALVGIALLIWLVLSVDWRLVLAALRRGDPFWIAAGVVIFVMAVLPAAIRMQAAFNLVHLPLAAAVKLTLGSYVFNQLLPGGLGGDAYRALRLKNGAGGWAPSLGLIVFERAVGALTLLLPALGFALLRSGGSNVLRELRWDAPRFVSSVPVPIILLAAAVLLIFSVYGLRFLPRLLHLLFDVASRLSTGSAFRVVVWSLVFHALRIAGAAAFVAAVGYSVSAAELTVVMGLALLGSILPVSLGALGIREGILVYALEKCGVPPVEGLVVALLMRLVVILLGVLGILTLHSDRLGMQRAASPGPM